ncbi:MAG: hypothetical protein JWR84_1238 [Caulobacter sp.]|nr:hypothetical protein [Caulobacter sp.]
MSDTRGLDEHERESVDTVARLHRKHDEAASGLQRVIDGFTDGLGRPATAVVLTTLILVWLAAAAMQSDGRLDGPLALWLELAATLGALIIAVLILASQRRSDAFAARRAALTLDLALLADRKNAKIIALLEELRRDAPQIEARPDAESDEMATPVDPKALVRAIDESVGRPQS